MSSITGSCLNVVETFVKYGGVTGTATTTQITSAMQVAWEKIEEEIGTFLQPTDVSDEVHPWPHVGMLQLANTNVISMSSVIAKHDENTCTCTVTDVTGCSILIDAELGIVNVKECYRSENPCARCVCASGGWGKWAVISYRCGLTCPPEEKLQLALVLLAKSYLAVMTGGMDEFGELKEVETWRSMDYSESYKASDKSNPFSTQYRSELIQSIIKNFKKKRVVGFAMNPRSPLVI